MAKFDVEWIGGRAIYLSVVICLSPHPKSRRNPVANRYLFNSQSDIPDPAEHQQIPLLSKKKQTAISIRSPAFARGSLQKVRGLLHFSD